MCCYHLFDYALQFAECFHIRAYSVYHLNSCYSSHFTNEFMTYEGSLAPSLVFTLHAPRFCSYFNLLCNSVIHAFTLLSPTRSC